MNMYALVRECSLSLPLAWIASTTSNSRYVNQPLC